MPPTRKVDLEAEFPILLDAAIDNKLTVQEAFFMLMGRLHENGPPGTEFGVKIAAGKGLRRQAGEFAATVVNNRKRYDDYLKTGGKPNYTTFFAQHGSGTGNGWAPIVDVPEDEAEFNKNWPGSVDELIGQHLSKWMPRIKEWYSDEERKAVIKDKQTSPLP